MANGEVKENSGFLGLLRTNIWVISTIVLAIVLVIVLVLKSGGITGSVISEKEISDKVSSFAKSYGDLEVLSVEKESGLYKVNVKFNGEEMPIYVTLDGKYLAGGLVPLETKETRNNKNSNVQPEIKEVPKSDKPNVELFVMSLCPFGLQIEKGILPVVVLLKDKIDFSVKFVYYIMHDKAEIDENTRQYCIQKEQKDKFVNYLTCYLKEGKTEDCLKEAKIDKTKLNLCINATDKKFNITANYNDKNSWLNGRYPKYNVNLADNERYGVGGSPTLIINGVEVPANRDSASLLKAICSAFNKEPEECKQTLSSASPSPGFGYSASGGGSSGSATCG
ncbi:MAG: hypothetical protein N3D20_02440 [Candidatus Pacearchaeota archaeon]|nr:hypothetical protein [Candidatus Pacearchaeota archaeon]